MTTLAVRNNNPCNIRTSKEQFWHGQTGANEGFCVFSEAKFGFRAAYKILESYWNEGIDNVDEAIEHWAPPNENNTAAYKADVAKHIDWPADQIVNLPDPRYAVPLLKAIATHESGGWFFSDRDIADGIALA